MSKIARVFEFLTASFPMLLKSFNIGDKVRKNIFTITFAESTSPKSIAYNARLSYVNYWYRIITVLVNFPTKH